MGKRRGAVRCAGFLLMLIIAVLGSIDDLTNARPRGGWFEIASLVVYKTSHCC